jgi:hypothetical protein
MTDASTAFRSLRYEVADRKAYITLNQPECLGAIVAPTTRAEATGSGVRLTGTFRRAHRAPAGGT